MQSGRFVQHLLELHFTLLRSFKLVEQFLQQLESFSAAEPTIEAVVLVGSHANGTAKSDSDVDVVIVTNSTDRLLGEYTWVYKFGKALSSDEEDCGLVHALRVMYDGGPEVEFGITSKSWIADDQLKDTGKILAAGYRVIYDPNKLIDAFYDKSKAAAAG